MLSWSWNTCNSYESHANDECLVAKLWNVERSLGIKNKHGSTFFKRNHVLKVLGNCYPQHDKNFMQNKTLIIQQMYLLWNSIKKRSGWPFALWVLAFILVLSRTQWKDMLWPAGFTANSFAKELKGSEQQQSFSGYIFVYLVTSWENFYEY